MARSHGSRSSRRARPSSDSDTASASASSSDDSNSARSSDSSATQKEKAGAGRKSSSDDSARASDSASSASDSGSDSVDDKALIAKPSSHVTQARPRRAKRVKAAARNAALSAQAIAARHHHKTIALVSIIVGILVAGALGIALYLYMSKSAVASSASTTAAAPAIASATATASTSLLTSASPPSPSAPALASEASPSSSTKSSTESSTSLPASSPAVSASKAPSSAHASSTATPTTSSPSQIIAGWWPAYSSALPSAIDWTKYTHAFFFDVSPSGSPAKLNYDASDDSFVTDFVKAVHAGGAKAMMTIGGWDGSSDFSSIMASADSRTSFIKVLQEATTKYGYDGLDFDWEYPGAEGATKNFSKDDLANFLLFLQVLRKAVGTSFVLSAATSSDPWVDETGSPSKDLSAFGDVLDFIEIMQYDGNSEETMSGPNFPLSTACAPSGGDYALLGVQQSTKGWIDAKFPANKIVLGLGAYGHTYLVPKFSSTGSGSNKTSTVYQTAKSAGNPDTMLYSDLVAKGWVGGPGKNASVQQVFDECTSTPFVYSKEDTLLVPYDDARSIAAKCKYGKALGTAGAALFSVDGDSGDVLVQAMIDNC